MDLQFSGLNGTVNPGRYNTFPFPASTCHQVNRCCDFSPADPANTTLVGKEGQYVLAVEHD